MADVEFKLIADNQQYINAIREAQRANQNLYNSTSQEQRKEKSLISDITNETRKLEDVKKEAWDSGDLEKYNQKVGEGKEGLEDFEKTGRKNVKTTKDQSKAGNNMVSTLKRWAIGLASVTAITKGFSFVMSSTKKTADSLAASKAALKARVDVLAKSLATLNFKGIIQRMREAGAAAREYENVMAELGDRKRALTVEEEEYRDKLNQLGADMRDVTLSTKERQKALDEFTTVRKKLANEEIDIANKELEATSDAAAKKIDMNGEQLEAFIRNYNETRNLREEAVKMQEWEAKESQRITDDLMKSSDLTIEVWGGKGGTTRIGEELTKEGEKILQERLNMSREMFRKENHVLESFTQEQIDNYLAYLDKYGDATDDELDIVANAMNARSQAKQRLTADERELVRIRAQIFRENQRETDAQRKITLDKEKQFNDTILDIRDQAETKRIEALTGEERIFAEEEFNLKQIDKLEKSLEEMGELTDDHYQLLDTMREDVQNVAIDQQIELHKERQALLSEHNSEILALNRELEESALDLIEDNEKEKLALKIMFLEDDKALLLKQGDEISKLQADIIDNQIALLNKKLSKTEGGEEEDSPIRTILGLNPDQLGALKDAAGQLMGVMNDIFEARVRDAERNRQLADTRISELQRELDLETELMRDGYAHNVEAKKEELDRMQQVREEAIRREEAAIKAQRLADSVAQTSNLITASSDVFKQFSKIPVIGIPLAIAMIGTMFGAFAAAKVKARESTKLAKGGTGVVTGNLHSQGGEAFGDHIEVERGERWGVLSRSASQKYGKVFEQMVNSFNKGKMPMPGVPILNSESEKTVGELIEIKDEMKNLNNHFRKKTVEYSPGMRIERGRNRVRIIRRNV